MIRLLIFTAVVLISRSLPAQNRYDIIIDEIMADPTPQIGLPNNEWIEIKNVSAAPVNLQNWRIGDASSQSGPLPNITLQPDSFLVICASSAVTVMSAFGTTISVTSFPSLDNDGDQLFLKASNGKIIHAVSYTSAWYQNEIKKDGGWTLEMTDTQNPCSGFHNWKASVHTTGGTPGKKNSIDAVNTDVTPPALNRAYITDSITIILVYDEPLDSASGATPGHYTLDGALTILSATTIPPLFDKVQLKLVTPMITGTVYHITATSVKDCKGNNIGSSNKTKVGIPSPAAAGNCIINEILFNPRSAGYDFVELYNNSHKILDASKLFIANRNSSNVISSIKSVSILPFYIFPGEYIVLTENADILSLDYLVTRPEQVLIVSPLPTYPDDEGDVVVLNFQGEVTDEVRYKDNWHFKLLDNTEGISLERIDPSAISQNETNWHSAASTAGYATPGYRNSQYKVINDPEATITLIPKVFSPDNDGRDDIATVQYKITEPGYVANITIFDASGRVARNLVQNGTMGLSGYWNWDGLNDKQQRLSAGAYIIFTEIFNLQGKKKQFKNVILLAGKLH